MEWIFWSFLLGFLYKPMLVTFWLKVFGFKNIIKCVKPFTVSLMICPPLFEGRSHSFINSPLTSHWYTTCTSCLLFFDFKCIQMNTSTRNAIYSGFAFHSWKKEGNRERSFNSPKEICNKNSIYTIKASIWIKITQVYLAHRWQHKCGQCFDMFGTSVSLYYYYFFMGVSASESTNVRRSKPKVSFIF